MIWLNRVLVPALIAWFLAQVLKVPISYAQNRKWNWSLWFSPGGMPSSHSALVISTMISTGLYAGFETPIFAIAVALAMIVIYDAAGVRREAGRHAERINTLINELLNGHPLSEENLKEVLGHTPGQVGMGSLLGIVISLLFWLLWH